MSPSATGATPRPLLVVEVDGFALGVGVLVLTLALIELATRLTQQQQPWRGQVLGEVIPIGRRLENHFLAMVRSLDARAVSLLVVGG
jgi:hypothetical protein